MLHLCVQADERAAAKVEWSSSELMDASLALKTQPSTRLALALRSSTYLKILGSYMSVLFREF